MGLAKKCLRYNILEFLKLHPGSIARIAGGPVNVVWCIFLTIRWLSKVISSSNFLQLCINMQMYESAVVQIKALNPKDKIAGCECLNQQTPNFLSNHSNSDLLSYFFTHIESFLYLPDHMYQCRWEGKMMFLISQWKNSDLMGDLYTTAQARFPFPENLSTIYISRISMYYIRTT